MNAKNEKPALPGGSLSENFSGDTEIVQHSSKKINGIAQAPAGFGFENDQLVPVTMPSQDEEISSELLEFSRRVGVLYGWALAQEISPKLAAVRFVLGDDRRAVRDIAEDVGCSKRLIEIRISEAKKILARLQLEGGK